MLLPYPVLRNVNFSLPFTLQVDASDVAVGAVLTQTDEGAWIIQLPISAGNYYPGNRNFLLLKRNVWPSSWG